MANPENLTNRRQARELAVQVLFQSVFVPDLNLASRLDYFKAHLDISEGAWSYAEKILTGLENKITEIDAIISDKSRNWKIERIAPVDLCILRIGAYEILHPQSDVPPKVAIDEAVEIAKRYGGTESAPFINGILDEIYRTTK